MPADPPFVLTINGGSSSIKFALLTLQAFPERLLSGAVTAIGTLTAVLTMQTSTEDVSVPLGHDGTSHAAAVARLVAALEPRLPKTRLAVIAHRVVHGGDHFDRTSRITSAVIHELTRLIPLAPNHLSNDLALIEAFARARPDVPQIACFDTAFHHDLPDVARTLPVPHRFGEPILRRYGFHGLSYSFVRLALEEVAGADAARGRVVLAHLGNGASLAALKGGRCIDTSMGLTPTGGLVMGTRAGDLDPGVVTHLARLRHLSVDQMQHVLTHESGLLAISGRSADMQDLLTHENTDPRARLAVDVFCYQARKWIGAFAAALGGLDTLVFTGGIGEHAAPVRSRICEPLAFLGMRLDSIQNERHAPVISAVDARVSVRVIATDETLMMAKEAHRVLAEAF